MDWLTPRRCCAFAGVVAFAGITGVNVWAVANDVIGAKHISPLVSKAFVGAVSSTGSAVAVNPSFEISFPGPPLKNWPISNKSALFIKR